MRMRGLIALPALFALVGCDNGSDPTDTDTGPQYEAGCILVDGVGGYAKLDDAFTVAKPGSTIDLCFDLNQVALEIDADVVIHGNGHTITPPVNSSALTVLEGGKVTLDNIKVVTTRSAFVVQGGGSLTLSDADVGTPPNYGIDVQSGATVVAERVTMLAPEWGGVKVSGGDLTLRDSTISSPGSYGVYVENDGKAVLEGNNFEGARNKDTESGLFDLDGVAVWGESGANITMTGNTMTSPDIVGVSVEDGTLSMDSDTILGVPVGVSIRNTKATLSGVSNDIFGVYGFLAVASKDVTLDSVMFVTDPEVARPPTLDDNGSVGLYAIESKIVVTGTAENPSRFEGANGAGVIVTPSGGGGTVSEITMSDTVVANNGAFGISIYSGEATLTNVEILDTRNFDDVCAGDAGQRCNMAMALWSSNATLNNSTVKGNDGWGVTVVNGSIDLTDGLIADNEVYALFAQTGSITAKGTHFEDGRAYQVYAHTDSVVVLDSVSFKNGAYTSEYVNDTTRSITYYNARDVYISDADLIIKDSTFENGEYGINVNGYSGGADVEITNTTFSGYNQQVLSVGTGSTWKVRDVTMDDVGNYALYCYTGTASLKNVKITNVNEYAYKWEYFQDGELLYNSEYDSIGRGMYNSGCTLDFEDVSMDGVKGQAFYATNSSIEADGFSVSNALTATPGSQPAVELTWNRRIDGDGNVDPLSYPLAYVNKLSVMGVPGANGVRLQGWLDPETLLVGEGTVSIRDLVLGGSEEGQGISGNGMEVNDIGDLQIIGMDSAGIGQNAVVLNRTDASVEGTVGVRMGVIASPGMTGVVVDANRKGTAPSKVTLKNLTVNSPGTSGVTLSGGEHTISNVTVDKAVDYGMVCAVETTLDTCDASLDGAMGPHSGCTACDL